MRQHLLPFDTCSVFLRLNNKKGWENVKIYNFLRFISSRNAALIFLLSIEHPRACLAQYDSKRKKWHNWDFKDQICQKIDHFWSKKIVVLISSVVKQSIFSITGQYVASKFRIVLIDSIRSHMMSNQKLMKTFQKPYTKPPSKKKSRPKRRFFYSPSQIWPKIGKIHNFFKELNFL